MYSPGNLPNTELKDLVEALRLEFLRISTSLSQPTEYLALKTLYAAPSRIFEGMVVKADGVSWDPSGGAGVYVRINNAWVKL